MNENLFQKFNRNEKKQTLERQDPRIQANQQEKSKEHFKTIAPVTNDSNTQYHTGSIGVAQKSKLGKKTANSVPLEASLEDRLKKLGVGDENEARDHSLVELLKQALHNHDAT